MKLETERLVIRELTLDDAGDIFEYAKDKDTGPRAGWQPHENIETTIGLIKMWIDNYNKKEEDNNYVIVWKENNKVVGTIGITDLRYRSKSSQKAIILGDVVEGINAHEIGITIAKDYWGKGIATEATEVMIEYLIENGADMVVTSHFEANVASGRVQEKLGLKPIGSYIDDHPWYNTDNANHIVRMITKEEYLEKNKESIKE